MICIECNKKIKNLREKKKCFECKNPMCSPCHDEMLQAWAEENNTDKDNISIKVICNKCFMIVSITNPDRVSDSMKGTIIL